MSRGVNTNQKEYLNSYILPGIYCITNTITGKKYIGSSKNITNRWYFHLGELTKGIHNNKAMQDDFNTYGCSAFAFSILQVSESNDTKILRGLEHEYIVKYKALGELYNLKDELKYIAGCSDEAAFTDYICSKWLVPIGVEGMDNFKYRIYKKEDRAEIVQKFIECKLAGKNKRVRDITFLSVVKCMKRTMGYTIEDKLSRIKKRNYHYKLIVDYDPCASTYEPAIPQLDSPNNISDLMSSDETSQGDINEENTKEN